jgi:hypothetical protein
LDLEEAYKIVKEILCCLPLTLREPALGKVLEVGEICGVPSIQERMDSDLKLSHLSSKGVSAALKAIRWIALQSFSGAIPFKTPALPFRNDIQLSNFYATNIHIIAAYLTVDRKNRNVAYIC